ncbi:MAG: UvrD-helicase domain-containing protein [Lachnospiraceae bacterium]|nr:UvrD-helicase domain-containing protein [Lachnospiraceae bacterium]
MDIYSSLNDRQLEAVMHERGPLLILAGAGSGKTRVITHRIARLISECGVSPYRILAITFTNKAADEMKERVARLLDDEFNDVWISTFHSACVRMLRKFCETLGFEQNFTIYDTDDQKRAMKDVLRHLNIDVKQLPPKQVLAVISKAKNELVGPDDFRASAFGRTSSPDVARAYKEYQELLKKSNAFDFDDLLMMTVTMLRENPTALAYYQNRFEHIMVDEYQDTNTAQFELIRLLATHINDEGEPEHNLCVVGDDDQSIYRFRGANIRNILDFEKTYPDARVIKLEQNYRSTKRILEAANTVIANNLGRKAKSLWSDKGEGDLIRVVEYPSDIDEAKEIVRDIAGDVRSGHGSYRDHAILYRTNAQSRAFEEQFVYSGIPYRLVGGVNFYERMEIRDMLAYLRVIENGSDAVSIKRVINVPKRGIGDTTVERADDYAYMEEVALYEALQHADRIPGLSARAVTNIRKFTDIIDEIREALTKDDYPLTSVIDDLLEATGYEDDLREQDPEKADDRIDNITELKNKIAQYAQNADSPTLSGFLAEVALVADIDAVDNDSDYVILMTLHSAKGLEFDHVYISGLEEGLFPSGMSLEPDSFGHENTEGLEEERRLFYVGVTRARETLCLSYTKQRMVRGELQFNRPSRFINELPREAIRKSTFGGSSWGERSSMRGSLNQLAGNRSARSGYSGSSYGGSSYDSSNYDDSDYNYDSGYRKGSGYSNGSGYNSGAGYRDSSRKSGAGSGYGNSSGYSNGTGYGNTSGYGSGSGYGAKRPYTSSGSSSAGTYKNPYTSTPAPSPAATSASSLGFGVGDRVRHIKFGVGTVKEITQGSHDFEVTVEFAAGTKVMLASFAKLVKVES